MKKILLFILISLSLVACKPSPKKIAEKFMYERSYHPDKLKILSCNCVFRPERTKTDTFYHIAAVDGIKGLRPYEWHYAKAIYSDSIRLEVRHQPANYYCCATVECVSDCGDKINTICEVVVLPDGTPMMEKEYENKYYGAVTTVEYPQQTTLTDLRDHIDLSRYCKGWGLKQMLLEYHAPNE